MVSYSLDVVTRLVRNCALGRGDPVFQRRRSFTGKPRRTGSPAPVRAAHKAGDDSCAEGESEAHQPSNSGLRGSSTALTFSSLIAPFAMRSLRSPSVAPAILVR